LWTRLFLVLASGAGLTFGLMLLSPSVAEWLTAFSNSVQSPAVEFCTKLVPGSSERLCRLGGNTYLALWLYAAVIIIFVAEKAFPADIHQPVIGTGSRHDCLMWFFGNGVFKAGAGLTVLFVVGWLYERFLSDLSLSFTKDWSNTWRAIAGLILADLLNWGHHYLRHKVPALWQFHAVHHSQTQMNPFTDYRIHFVEFLVSKPIVLIPLLMLNLPVEQAIAVVIFQRCYTMAYHANLKTNFGPLRYILVTPQSHRIHHSASEQHRDRNFGVIFSVWDRLFGTHYNDAHEYPAVGVRDPDFPMEHGSGLAGSIRAFVRQNLYPFQQVLRRRVSLDRTIGSTSVQE